MTRISISEAARRWKKSRTTIQNLVKQGRLEVVHSGQAKTVGIAELVQVLGEPDSAQQVNAVQVESQVDDKQVSRLWAQIDRQNDLIEKLNVQIEDLNKQLAQVRRPILPRLLPWMKD